jgi:hypothetical protein
MLEASGSLDPRHQAGLELLRRVGRDALSGLPSRTACLTLLAGAGSRWKKTLGDAKARIPPQARDAHSLRTLSFPLEAPRGLFPVKNRLTPNREYIPLAAYAVDAFKNLGRQGIVIRGWEKEIRREVLEALGIDPRLVGFATQFEGPEAKVLGHGDATYQAMDLWKDSDFVMVNFGGDANSPFTALISLVRMEIWDREEEGVDLGIPVARIPGSAYPIFLDSQGLPRVFGHDKLGEAFGKPGEAALVRSDFANVGIRVYKTNALFQAMEEIRRRWWDPSTGYSIPGNNPESHEFALDNVDAMMAQQGRARILPIARPEELTPAKSFNELLKFEDALDRVRDDWEVFSSALDAEDLAHEGTGDGV